MSGATREPRSGELRRRIVLEAASRTADGGGGASLAWTAVATLWASVRALSGEERVAAGRLSGRLSHEIVIRRRAGVTPNLRFRVGSRRRSLARRPPRRQRHRDRHPPPLRRDARPALPRRLAPARHPRGAGARCRRPLSHLPVRGARPVRITVTVDGAAALARLDLSRIEALARAQLSPALPDAAAPGRNADRLRGPAPTRAGQAR